MVTVRRSKLPVAISWHERKLRFRMLDVRRLRVLRELAARGTIAATADALGYTAPAVSQQLAALEREAGRRAARAQRPPTAPDARRRGARRAHRGHPARARGGRGGARAHHHARRRRPALRGASRAPTALLLPRAIAALAERHPDLRVTTRDHGARGQPARAQARRARPRARAGVRVLRPRRPTRRSSAPDLLDDPLRVALPESHRWPAPTADRHAELAAEPWIAGREGTFCHRSSSTRRAQRATSRGWPTSPTTSPSRTRSSRPAPASGSCPELAGPPPPGVVVRPVKGAPPSRRIYAAVRAGSGARPAIAAMLDALTAR